MTQHQLLEIIKLFNFTKFLSHIFIIYVWILIIHYIQSFAVISIINVIIQNVLNVSIMKLLLKISHFM